MISKILNYSMLLAIGIASLTLNSCNDDDAPSGTGDVSFEITDAPSDDANVKGVFVTVADVEVDGVSIGLAQKQTIDLTAYANGQTKLLGTAKLDAKNYNSITLILDNQTDANGNAPGNYLLTTDDVKYKLTSTSTGTTKIVMNKSIDVTANATHTIVMDFDLRKAIQRNDNANVKYQFVNEIDLRAAVRVMNKAKTGIIMGTYKENFNSNADVVIVYVYNKGEFNQSNETTPDNNGIMFKNAKSSAMVKNGLTDSYALYFLEEGDYEVAFAAYNKNTTTNQFELNTMLDANLQIGGNTTNSITIGSGVTISLTSTIVGLL